MRESALGYDTGRGEDRPAGRTGAVGQVIAAGRGADRYGRAGDLVGIRQPARVADFP